MNGVPQVFDLEPGCAFRLHGERVRPRLLLPQDYARVTYTEVRDAKVAHTVHVR